MLKFVAVTLVVCTAAGSAVAQEEFTVPRNTLPKAAVANPAAQNPSAPVAGKNSFTQTQARARIEKMGYTQVSDLSKDMNAIWRGNAVRKDGTAVQVALDYQGNVTEE
jgi:hypothetical protein